MFRTPGVIVLSGFVALTAVACGGNKQETAAKQAEQSAAQTQKAVEQAAGGFNQMAQTMGAMAGGDANVKPVDPVSFKDLQTTFPEKFAGWERSKPTGERMTAPVNFSQASVRYTKGDASLELKVTDSGFNQLLVAPFMMAFNVQQERETENGYEKTVKIADNPGFEKWNSADKSGEVTAFVAKRFLVEVDGHGVADAKAMRQLIEAMDLKKLAALK